MKVKMKGKRWFWLLAALIIPVGYGGFAITGNLEPPGSPAPTMRTLEELQPAWSKKITDASKRFETVLDGAGVLDKETGLVWEKSPDTTTRRTWFDAVDFAYKKNVGGLVSGWRLPTVEELRSLIDPTQNNPALLSGYKDFFDVEITTYWTSTTDVNKSNIALHVTLNFGQVSRDVKDNEYFVWCVRGGHGHDAPSLEELQSSWSKKITDASKRFEIVLDGAAVLDKETGLVWEKSPINTTVRTWFEAIEYAYNKNDVGGRVGWRLPTVEELRSLIDPSESNPALPKGHKFTNVQSDLYWSSTTDANNINNAWVVNILSGNAALNKKSIINYVWCVRGGQGHDAPSETNLNEIPPTWSKKIDVADDRFELVLGDAAVLDKETGLVWEKSPDNTQASRVDAIFIAYNNKTGGRKGWRLPTVEELASLVDPNVSGSLKLPSGHKFTNVLPVSYWSSTDQTWHVDFSNGDVSALFRTGQAFFVWCVRGGHGCDAP